MPVRTLVFSAALLAVLSSGCSSDDAATEESSGPVASSPLRGTIEGAEFVAASARARRGFEEGEKMLEIFDIAVGCDERAPSAPRLSLIHI